MDPMGNWGNNSLQVTGPKVNAADCRLRCHRRYRCRLPSEWSSFDVAHNVGGSSRNCAADWPKSPKLQSQNTCERELCGAGCVAWMPFDAIQTRFPLWLHAMWLVCLPSHVKRVIMECYLAHQLDTCSAQGFMPPRKVGTQHVNMRQHAGTQLVTIRLGIMLHHPFNEHCWCSVSHFSLKPIFIWRGKSFTYMIFPAINHYKPPSIMLFSMFSPYFPICFYHFPNQPLVQGLPQPAMPRSQALRLRCIVIPPGGPHIGSILSGNLHRDS